MIKKILKYVFGAILLLVISCSVYIYVSSPSLPKEVEVTIENTLDKPLPECIKGETGFAVSQGLNIWYESLEPRDSSKGVVVLIMGISNDALGWPANFIQSIVDADYQVIRYDHRGTGMSDWVDNWNPNNPYSLADMANDVQAILDTLEIEKAHVIGVSMGGMIAQEFVLNHPDRAESLCSIMSSGNIFDSELPPISSTVAFDLIKVALKYGIVGGEKNIIKLHLASRMILMGEATQSLGVKEIAQQVLYNIRKRKGYNINVSKQHQAAVSMSGSRYDRLKTISKPTLIIHGKQDPFIPIAHGEKCLSLISQADSLWLDNMGHDLPDELVKEVTEKIINHFEGY